MRKGDEENYSMPVSYTHLDVYKRQGILSDYEAARHQAAVERRQELENLNETRIQVQQEYDSLDFLYLDRMRRQIEELSLIHISSGIISIIRILPMTERKPSSQNF